jgi:iron(III) transport system substrate-binding protein
MTSDLFWYLEMKQAGKFLPYTSPAAADVPAEFRDPDGAFTTVRIPVVVLAYNSKLLKPGELPERWKDLAEPRWKNRLSIGSPFEVATSFFTVAMLSRTFGWDFFRSLRKNELVAEGGHASVLSRLETGERTLGVLTLDALLKAQAKGSPARVIYPLDGVIPVPCPLALLKSSEHPEVAKKVYDWFFSTLAQNVIVRAGSYSPIPKIVSPDRTRPWNELKLQMMPYSPRILGELYPARDQIRARFSELVLH